MSYHYEFLGDQKFQLFSQALITREHPDVQCLPIGLPDGGRDAFEIRSRGGSDEFIVFQIKFSRDPSTKDSRQVVLDVIESEKEKVIKLKKMGATKYVLITNVRGTSHLESGSIDKGNEMLLEAFDIPSIIWWRDDLDARTHANADIKWSFPDILKGQDVLQLLVNQSDKENNKRQNTLKAYLSQQYLDDKEVKFKQVELQNNLVELFVDLPVARSHDFLFNQENVEGDSILKRKLRRLPSKGDSTWNRIGLSRTEEHVEAAEFLLNLPVSDSSHCIILEGAPGQGKSTISQFITQVHRIKLLPSHSAENDQLANIYKDAPSRIPFKIDIRDFAAWQDGQNPFRFDENKKYEKHGMNLSLETFLATQVSELSGGLEFSIDDLSSIIQESHVLIVLDGLDEIANLDLRKKTIESVNRSYNRIKETSKSVVLVITSRPAAFSNNLGFNKKEWLHISLLDLPRKNINIYAQKWMFAKGLSEKEKEEFLLLINKKLDEAHMRDLARNTMQLTILLTLIQSQGVSLPDKRTALYDEYMKLFFNRESEKSEIVRENRDLLINIHRYLAWSLQTAAESDGHNGSISTDGLKKLISDYLNITGHPQNLIDSLFTGTIERVVALVSRVEGTFEFEVQPLREYFAARYLYNTATYSPVGNEKRGTLLDRFEALSQNYYWLNVCRYYCGCYSAGELASLKEGLLHLVSKNPPLRGKHPKKLAFMLLGDWVFSQTPRVIEELINFYTSPENLKTIISLNLAPFGEGVVSLPQKCGREKLSTRLKHILLNESNLRLDEFNSVCLWLNQHISEDESYDFWEKICASDLPKNRSLIVARDLNALSRLSILDALEVHEKVKDEIVIPLLNCDRFDVVYKNSGLINSVIKMFLDPTILYNTYFIHEPVSGLKALQFSTNIGVYRDLLQEHSHNFIIINEFLATGNLLPKEPDHCNASVEIIRHMRSCVENLVANFEKKNVNWKNTLAPWDEQIKVFNNLLGNNRFSKVIAIIGAGVRSSADKGLPIKESSCWFGDDFSIQKIRYARLKAGNSSWWEKKLTNINKDDDELLILVTFFCWASPLTIQRNAELVSKLVEELSSKKFEDLHQIYLQVMRAVSPIPSKIQKKDIQISLEDLSLRFKMLFLKRCDRSLQSHIFYNFLMEYNVTENAIKSELLSIATKELMYVKGADNNLLEFIKKHYHKEYPLEFRYRPHSSKLSKEMAIKICSSPNDYPVQINNLAQERMGKFESQNIKKLRDVANEQEWFVDHS